MLASRPAALLLSGPPAPVEIDYLVARLRGQVPGLDPAGQADRLAHLGQVLGAVRAAGQVRLEPAAGPRAQIVFEVVGDQLDGLLADEITTAQQLHRTSLSSFSISCLSRLRPRCSRTRWFPSVRASTAQTSSLLIPSTSRSSTTSRWRAGRSSIQTRTCPASLPASIRRSAASIQCSGGSAQPPSPPNRVGSTAGSGSATGTLRCSLLPVLRARFTRMRNSHVFSDDRPWKASRPRSAASQVSCTTSSATARLGTNDAASASIGSW